MFIYLECMLDGDREARIYHVLALDLMACISKVSMLDGIRIWTISTKAIIEEGDEMT